MSETERGEVFDTLCSERFVDRSPAEVVATLLDEEVYLCSERTMYRVWPPRCRFRNAERRTHPEYKKPELMATAPNQVWSWDITRLLGPKKWSYYYLYVIMDIYSRYVVRWMVSGPGELGPGRPPDPAELPEAWRPAPPPDPALGSGSSNDEPMHRSTSR